MSILGPTYLQRQPTGRARESMNQVTLVHISFQALGFAPAGQWGIWYLIYVTLLLHSGTNPSWVSNRPWTHSAWGRGAKHVAIRQPTWEKHSPTLQESKDREVTVGASFSSFPLCTGLRHHCDRIGKTCVILRTKISQNSETLQEHSKKAIFGLWRLG